MTARKERRQSRRVAAEIALTVAGLDRSPIGARTLNLSAGGVYLRVPRQLAPLSKVAVEMELPAVGEAGERCRLEAEAVVVRCEPDTGEPGAYRVGIAFMTMSPRHRNRLEDYIDWRLTRSLLESAEAEATPGARAPDSVPGSSR